MCEQPTFELGNAPLVCSGFGGSGVEILTPWLIIAIAKLVNPAIAPARRTALVVPNCPDFLDRFCTCGLTKKVQAQRPKLASNSQIRKAPLIFMGRPTTDKGFCHPMTRGPTPDLPA